MKRLRLLFMALLLMGSTLAIYRYLPRIDLAWLSGNRDAWKLDYVPRANLSTAYFVDQSWVTFSLPSGVQQIKLITAPNSKDIDRLRQQRTRDPLHRWQYAIDLETIDSRGQTVLARTHYMRSDLTEIKDPEGRTITPTFYLGDPLTPLVGTVIVINLNGMTETSRIKFRLKSSDPALDEVSVRVYVPEKKSDRQMSYLWSRLSAAAKERMAKGNVFSHELMLESERVNLLRNSWQPIGPLGTRGIDFRQRDLYVLNDYQGEAVDDPILPAGTLFGGNMLASIPLPEQGGKVKFTLQSLTTNTAPTSIPVQIRWLGPGPYARQTRNILWQPNATEFIENFAGGLLELSAPKELVVRAFLGNGNAAIDLNGEPQYDRPFLVTAGAPPRYSLRHAAAATPLRVTLRHLRTSKNALAAKVRYVFLDQNGSTLADGILPLQPQISAYDRVVGEPPDILVSDPTTVYFSAPANAARLDFLPTDADAPAVLVSVANRPPKLTHQSKLPADRFAFDPKHDRLPIWFPLRPDDYEAHLLAGRTRLLTTQQRPPEEKPELLTGAFEWEDIPPEGRWLGRQLFSPREPGAPWREEALPSTYAPLPPNSTNSLEFPPYFGKKTLAPRLVSIADGKTPWSADLWVDGKLFQTLRGAPGYGETELLPLPSGRHRLRINTPLPIRFFINHSRFGDDAYVARLAVKTSARQNYTTDLKGNEELTLRLFAPSGSSRASRLRIHIDGPSPPPFKPSDAWLLNDREIIMQPAPAVNMPVFDTNGLTVDAGQPVFLPIPPGAKGRYRIRVDLIDGPGGYLLLSRLSTDRSPQRRWLSEPALERHLEIHE